MHIYFLCDQKWRDLPSLTLIKMYLERMKYRVTIVSTKEAESLLWVFRPDCVVFNHMWDKRNVRLAHRLHAANVRVIVLPTEGATPTEIWGPMVSGEFSDYSAVDLYLSWNQATVEAILAAGTLPIDRLRVIGCPRLDFSVAPFKQSEMTRDQLCRHIGIYKERPIVAFASRFALARLACADEETVASFEKTVQEVGYAQCIERVGHRVRDVIKLQKEGLDSFLSALAHAASHLRDVQFLFKPHPNDDVKYTQSVLKKIGRPNTHLCVGFYIGSVLRASDVLVNSDCNTSVEGWINHMPVIDSQIFPDHTTAPDGRPDIQECNWVGRSEEEVVTLINQGLGNYTISDKKRSLRNSFLERWFHKVDGRRCRTAADEIHSFLADKPIRGNRLTMENAGGRRNVVRSTTAYLLGVPAGVKLKEAFKHRQPNSINESNGVFDKVITRRDVSAMQKKLRSFII